ncbi:MAG: Bax inhibitor-1/YccA family protein [Spirochaetota bacterium]
MPENDSAPQNRNESQNRTDGVEGAIIALRREVLNSMFLWLTAGLLVSAVVATYIHSTPSLLETMAESNAIFAGLIVGELMLVLFLSAQIKRLTAFQGLIAFLGYSVLTGAAFSVILSAHTPVTIGLTFFVVAGMFAAMSIYTRSVRSAPGSRQGIVFMGGVGTLLAIAVNLSRGSGTADWIVSLVGVALFVALTLYDTQQVLELMTSVDRSEGANQTLRRSPVGALRLYIDLINVFFLVLRIIQGKRSLDIHSDAPVQPRGHRNPYREAYRLREERLKREAGERQEEGASDGTGGERTDSATDSSAGARGSEDPNTDDEAPEERPKE